MPLTRPLVDINDFPPVPGLNPAEVGPHKFVLIDDDQRMCRVIDDAEFDESYLDSNIATFKLRGVDWLTLAVDKEIVDLTYFDPRKASMLLGSISLDLGRQAPHYAKVNGVIYPIDLKGFQMLNGANTPNLVGMRRWYHAEVKRLVDERVEIGEVVHAFTKNIARLGTAGR